MIHHLSHPQHFLRNLLLSSLQQAALVTCSDEPCCCPAPLLLLQRCCERADQQRGSNNASPHLLPASPPRQVLGQSTIIVGYRSWSKMRQLLFTTSYC
jgi:hypothetical protein